MNSAQIVNGTLNVNETVRLAEASLETLCQPLALHVRRIQSVPYDNFPAYHATTDATADRELVARPG